MKSEKLLEVINGNVIYKKNKVSNHALKDLDIVVYKDEVLGLVGESGSGKSTLGRVLTQLQYLTSGELFFEDENITKSSNSKKRDNKKHLQYIFQDAKASLNPRKKVGWLLEEPLKVHSKMTKEERVAKVKEMLEMVRLPEDYLEFYPSALSGGTAQRIAILASLMNNPSFVVADEIVSALDVSIQAEVLNYLTELKSKFNMTVLFITHDIRVCYLVADRIAVMYGGRILEEGAANEIYENPMHPYSVELFNSVFSIYDEPANTEFLDRNIDCEKGCPYYDRCVYAVNYCLEYLPKLYEVDGRKVRCFRYSEMHKRKFPNENLL